MPRYYFHIRNHDDQLIEDGEGMEFPNDVAALAEAADSARDLAASAIREGRPIARHIEVVSEAGEPLFTFPVRSVIH